MEVLMNIKCKMVVADEMDSGEISYEDGIKLGLIHYEHISTSIVDGDEEWELEAEDVDMDAMIKEMIK